MEKLLRVQPNTKPQFNATVATIQDWLTFLGFKYRVGNGTFEVLKPNGLYDEKTERVVTDFQRSESIYADGIVGPTTMKALERAYTNRMLELNSPGKDFSAAAVKMSLDPVLADKYDEGYLRGHLRTDAASSYKLVREEVIAQGAILTSSGMMRSLNAQVTASRSAVSFHYLGLALDLYIYSGMVDPKKDPYVVFRENDRLHRIYARCSKDWTFNSDKPAKMTLPEEKTIKGLAITYKNRDAAEVSLKGRFIDLTAIFEKNGFKRINARKSFYDGDSMMGAEWWHFQYEKALLKNVSTFGNELLKIYAEQTLVGTSPWEQRNRIFGVNWF
jgi:hypothetical protein